MDLVLYPKKRDFREKERERDYSHNGDYYNDLYSVSWQKLDDLLPPKQYKYHF